MQRYTRSNTYVAMGCLAQIVTDTQLFCASFFEVTSGKRERGRSRLFHGLLLPGIVVLWTLSSCTGLAGSTHLTPTPHPQPPPTTPTPPHPQPPPDKMATISQTIFSDASANEMFLD